MPQCISTSYQAWDTCAIYLLELRTVAFASDLGEEPRRNESVRIACAQHDAIGGHVKLKPCRHGQRHVNIHQNVDVAPHTTDDAACPRQAHREVHMISPHAVQPYLRDASRAVPSGQRVSSSEDNGETFYMVLHGAVNIHDTALDASFGGRGAGGMEAQQRFLRPLNFSVHNATSTYSSEVPIFLYARGGQLQRSVV